MWPPPFFTLPVALWLASCQSKLINLRSLPLVFRSQPHPCLGGPAGKGLQEKQSAAQLLEEGLTKSDRHSEEMLCFWGVERAFNNHSNRQTSASLDTPIYTRICCAAKAELRPIAWSLATLGHFGDKTIGQLRKRRACQGCQDRRNSVKT